MTLKDAIRKQGSRRYVKTFIQCHSYLSPGGKESARESNWPSNDISLLSVRGPLTNHDCLC